MDTKQKTIVIVAVIIVVLVGVYAAQALDDKHEDARNDTYYFYLDGMDSHNGWYSASADNIKDAFTAATEDSGLTISFGSWNNIVIDEYPASTADSIGIGVYVYTSTNVSSPYEGYFALGPVLEDIIGNIVYITYGSYSFDENYNTTYSPSPSDSAAWKTSGPFATDSDYEAPSYDTYYFYLGGMGSADGWYSASGDNIKDAFVTATENSGLTISFGNWGQIMVEEYPTINDSSTGVGTGLALSDYLSTDTTASIYNVANSNYCPTLQNTASNIVIILYGGYTTDLTTYQMTYTNNPQTNTGWLTGGPFATA